MKLRYLFALLFPLSLLSCSGNNEDKTVDNSESIEISSEQLTEEDAFGEEASSFIIPSAFHISSLLQQAGLEYDDDAYNAVQNAQFYESKNDKLLNFGIYSTDLFFSVMKDQNDLSKQYIKVLKNISDETGMGSIFNASEVLNRFEANIENKDSILNLILEVQENTDMFIERSNEEHTAMLIFTGAWLEGMHLGFLSFNSNKDEELGRRLFEQACLTENVVAGLQAHPSGDENINKLRTEFENLHKLISETEAYKAGDFGLVSSKVPSEKMTAIGAKLKSIRQGVTMNASKDA